MSSFAKKYFQSTIASNYIKSTDRGVTADDKNTLDRAIGQLSPLREMIEEPRSIASIGAGEGKEIEALSHIFSDNNPLLFAVDISPEVLDTTKHYLNRRGIKAELIEADAAQLPFEDDSIDVICMMGILHEIYSYAVDGKGEYKKSISEAATKLAEGGILYIRDFVATGRSDSIMVAPQSELALDFYNYFRSTYRTFSSFKDALDDTSGLATAHEAYPALAGTDSHAVLPMDRAGELLLHFKNFELHAKAGTTYIGDENWKEINECYLVPNPNERDNQPMNREAVKKVILAEAQDALKNTPYSLELVYAEFSARPWVKDAIEAHYKVRDTIGKNDQTKLLNEVTRFMDIGFKKVRR